MSYSAKRFPAQIYHPDLGNELVQGQLWCDAFTLHFAAESASFDIPIVRLVVQLGDETDDRIRFTDRAAPDWVIYTDDEAVFEDHALKNSSQVREQLERIVGRRELSRRGKILAWCAGVCVALVLVAMLVSRLLMNAVVARISPETEKQFGEEVLAEFEAGFVFIDDTNKVQMLASIAKPLTDTVRLPNAEYAFHLMAETEPNAFALPGGHVVVTTGLVKLADQPEELLGVLAHEIAHVTEKHGFRQQISAAGPFLLFGVLFGGSDRGMSGLLNYGSQWLIASSFSQEYETDADDMGWQFMLRARLNPHGMITMFQKLKAWDSEQELETHLPQALSTHPETDKRIKRLESKWKKLKDRTSYKSIEAKTFTEFREFCLQEELNLQ